MPLALRYPRGPRRHVAARRIQKAWRRKKRPRFKKALALKPHNFVERLKNDQIQLNESTLDALGNLSTTFTRTFQMSDIPQIASYQTLFEYYTINKVVVEFRYKTAGIYANTDGSAATGRSMNEVNPTLIFKVDHNDINPDTVPVLMESMKTREKQLTNHNPNFSIQIKPAIQAELYKTALTSAYAPKWGVKLSMADIVVPHYGLKMNIQCPAATTSANFGTLLVQYKIYFTARNNE